MSAVEQVKIEAIPVPSRNNSRKLTSANVNDGLTFGITGSAKEFKIVPIYEAPNENDILPALQLSSSSESLS